MFVSGPYLDQPTETPEEEIARLREEAAHWEATANGKQRVIETLTAKRPFVWELRHRVALRLALIVAPSLTVGVLLDSCRMSATVGIVCFLLVATAFASFCSFGSEAP